MLPRWGTIGPQRPLSARVAASLRQFPPKVDLCSQSQIRLKQKKKRKKRARVRTCDCERNRVKMRKKERRDRGEKGDQYQHKGRYVCKNGVHHTPILDEQKRTKRKRERERKHT